MLTNAASLIEFFDAQRKQGKPLVLATIVRTIGSTYRKPGAHMLIASDGSAAGLLSGGCAESDLIERAQRVLKSGRAELAEYDTRGSDDVIWGIGLGCEGAMQILLTRLDTANDYQPYAAIADSVQQQKRTAFALSVDNAATGQSWHSQQSGLPVALHEHMQTVIATRAADTVQLDGRSVFVAPVELPPRLLILGAGADAMPVVEVAGLLGWQVTLADHRSAYAVAERFPRAQHVILKPAAELASQIELNGFDAAVVMSHHLPTDQLYLAMLADSAIGYVGLLGPPARRTRLLAELGDRAARLSGRLAGPVGLDIGAKTPEAIALAIVAEIHAHLHHRGGGSFSMLLRQ
jgi:xanthine dehydrogenase accessory factor